MRYVRTMKWYYIYIDVALLIHMWATETVKSRYVRCLRNYLEENGNIKTKIRNSKAKVAFWEDLIIFSNKNGGNVYKINWWARGTLFLFIIHTLYKLTNNMVIQCKKISFQQEEQKSQKLRESPSPNELGGNLYVLYQRPWWILSI